MLIRPATRADLEDFYDEPIPRLKAWVAVEDGVVGVAGYRYTPQALVVFSDLSFTGNKTSLARTAKMIVEDARSTGRTVIAFLDEDIGSERFLTWLGFTRENEYWRLDGDVGIDSDAVGVGGIDSGIDSQCDSHFAAKQGSG